MTKRLYILLFFMVFLFCSFSYNSAYSAEKQDVLWYRQPAKKWNEALPLGNGRLGIMIFGNTLKEHIQLNDDSMWPANPADWDEPDGDKNDLKHIRQLLFNGQNEKADKLFVEKFSRKKVVRSHQTMGDLFLEFNHKNITDYRRELNISNATSEISYKSDGKLIKEKIFVSNPHNAIIIQLETEGELNGKVRLTRPKDKGFPTSITKATIDKRLLMQGKVTQRGGYFDSKPYPILDGVEFETCLKIKNEGGKIISGVDFLELQNVKKATIYIVSNSSYYFDDYAKQNTIDLANVLKDNIQTVWNKHVEDYQSLYSRVQLSLNDNQLDNLPTDKRLKRIQHGATDTGLEALLFKYGRYLLISSSRPGTNPANLQGLWNNHIYAPWNADYHLNINLQMNYWLANLANLDELNMPLFAFIDKLVDNGKVTAKKNFGCNGAFIPHATDIWAPTWLRAPTAYWGCSLVGGGWMLQHYWQHYQFTRDTTFLKQRVYPALKAVANFYSDWLVEDPRDGFLVSAPSTSPENRFYNDKGKSVASCLGSAIDQQVIAEVFNNYIESCTILGISNPLLKIIKKQQKKLRAGFIVGSEGRILEWDREYKELEPGHRHMSHLYGFHPGVQITKSKNPKIFKAIKKTLEYRLANGGAGTGWSMAWLINYSARLMDGEMAYQSILNLIRKSISTNLFDLHPPFQIDGNFGYTAGVVEMLLQSHEKNTVNLLPALPKAWENGRVSGIKARGGLIVDMYWKNHILESAKITAQHPTSFNLKYKDKSTTVNIKQGESYVYTP